MPDVGRVETEADPPTNDRTDEAHTAVPVLDAAHTRQVTVTSVNSSRPNFYTVLFPLVILSGNGYAFGRPPAYPLERDLWTRRGREVLDPLRPRLAR